MTMRVLLSDIVVVPRVVDIPEFCDSCRADLRATLALHMLEWREEGAAGRLPSGQSDAPAVEAGAGIVVQADRIITGGHEGSGWVELRCTACQHVVVAGRRVIVANAAGRLIAQRIVTEAL